MRSRLFILFWLLFCILGCKENPTSQTIQGETWTTYSVKLQTTNSKLPALQQSIDSLLAEIDQSVSTYIDSSTISKFNKDNQFFLDAMDDQHFKANNEMAAEVFEQTSGLFDPTVKPLVDYYGFGAQKDLPIQIDSSVVDSMMEHVGYGIIGAQRMNKMHNYQLDFSAIAKGYMVDQVGELLESKGYEDYLVEIGGEVKAKGLNFEFNPWSLGIEEPIEDSPQGQHLSAIISLSDQSMATSGNYRNFKTINGQKVVHTINPRTGYPEISNLLSATIITDDCAFADAYATACMVMGLELSKYWIEIMDGIEGYLIYSSKAGEFESWASGGIRDEIRQVN